MPSKKKGKDRLDKYYHLAKDQGYRSRAAFKLIQLAKKFDFLSKSKVCLDLCAAPGGWAQVAQRNMPANSQIIAIDLAPIKPLHGVTCMQSDITSEKCRSMLRKEMTGPADVVLHDGAPNVGASWAKDAFGQNELTLFALKCACEHLKPGGVFVTKVFRSADYNSLLWVFNQLFHKVDATKPTASRNVSAEIFVMCINYKGGKVDPRFFDTKWVFMETMDPLGDEGGVAPKKPGATMNDHFANLAKKKRGGYEEGEEAGKLRILSAHDFVESRTPAEMLIKHHVMDFQGDQNEALLKDPLTTEAITEACKDLKVLGKRDLSTLLKWRMKILRNRESEERASKKADEKLSLALITKAKKEARAERKKSMKEEIGEDVDDAINQFLDGAPEEDNDDTDGDDSDEAEAKLTSELDQLVEKRRREERIDAKKTAARQKKQEMRKKLSLNTRTDAQDEPELLRASSLRSVQALEDQDNYVNPEESDDEPEEESDAEEDSDDELDRYARMEVDLAVAHELKKAHDGEKFRSSMQRKMKKKKETRRERVMAAWAGEFSAFNEALDAKAHTKYLADAKLDGDSDSDNDEDADSDDDADLKALRNQQTSDLFAGIDNSAMLSSIEGPELSVAARQLMDSTLEPKRKKRKADGDDEDGPSSDLVLVKEGGEEQLREQHRANRWFSQDIFKNVEAVGSDILPLDRDSEDEEEDDEGNMIELADKDLPKMPLTDKEKRKLVRRKEMEKLEKLGKKPVKDTTPMEVAPLEAPQPLNMSGPQKITDPRELAETLALGSILTNSKKSRMDLIDAGYNRYTFAGDEALPDWFTEEESKYNVPELPITKEMMDQWRAKLREINARPIRKVAEAKARKRRRLKLRLDKLRKTAMSLADTPDMSEASKARMMRKQVSALARQQERRCTTVAIKKGGGGLRGNQEKGKVPKGAKLKVVDRRMKNDERGLKRAEKRNKARSNAKNRKSQLKKQRKITGGVGPKNSGGAGGRGGIFGQGA